MSIPAVERDESGISGIAIPPSAKESWVLAFDCGTTSLKAAVINLQGAICGEASEGYKLYQDDDGLAEQDGDDIWAAMVRAGNMAVIEAGIDAAIIGSMVIAATWKAVLPLSAEGRPLSRAAVWLDSRGREQAKRLNKRAGRFIGTGQEYWPRVMWLKEERPDIWAAAEHIVGLNTYLKFRATGVLVNEPSDDFIYGVHDSDRAEFENILGAGNLIDDRGKFPKPLPPQSVVGTLTDSAAKQLRLRPGTLVFNGYGDLPAIMMGTGNGSPGQGHIYLGSSSWFVLATETPSPEAPLRFTVSDELYGAAYVLQSACLAYDWIVSQLYRAESAELGKEINALVNREVAEIEPGSGNLLATHWINGELPPLSKNSGGVFINLSSLHDRRHMVRAVMESVCYAHRGSYESYLSAGGAPLKRIRVVGGGATSDVWMQMLADVLGLLIEVPANPQSAGTLGAFYSAQVGLGNVASWGDVGETVRIQRRFHPSPLAGEVYSRLFAVHAQLHSTLHGVFSSLNGDY